MRIQSTSYTALGVLCATLALGQSLSEVAHKEKERRHKNKEEGKKTVVLTESDLERIRPASASSTEETVPSAAPASSPESSRSEGPESTDIPSGATLQEKLAVFQTLMNTYREDVQTIDEEIAKNNARIAEIDQILPTMGGSGLPVDTTQADMTWRNPNDVVALQSEQQELRERNQELEARKQTLAEELREKGRRAGIPPGYLRF